MEFQAGSNKMEEAARLLAQLQQLFIEQLQKVTKGSGSAAQFTPVEWLRDQGAHGGGRRFVASPGLLNSASINLSQIHFEDQPEKPLLSATALSAIVHPAHPQAPSIHLHISWSERRNGESFWRIMADLNPAISNEADRVSFKTNLKKVSGQYFQQGCRQGDLYFFIPALQRHRGVSHFYLEGFNDSSAEMAAFPQHFGQSVIECYCDILQRRLSATAPNEQEKAAQLSYHTLYFYQVLTLDRGTTAGLLAHNQNDPGTLGSLPLHINSILLASWLDKTAAPQDKLLKRLLSVLPESDSVQITAQLKGRIAEQLRLHYRQYPQ